jgi:hypothetical protein
MLAVMITAAEDTRAAGWLSRSAADMYTVHAMVPRGFAAYARIFHPAGLTGGGDVRWAEVAAANGRTMHGAAEWGQLTGSWHLRRQDGLWDHEPSRGRAPAEVGLRLAAVLAGHTGTTEDCWFAVWDGWGEGTVSALHLFSEDTTEAEKARAIEEWEAEQERRLAWARYVRSAPVFSVPHRGYHLLRGPLAEIDRFDAPGVEAPSIWWPEDRAWCVGGDVDLMTTYLGGSAAAIDAVLGDAELEALPIAAGQSVTWEADTVNPGVGPPG